VQVCAVLPALLCWPNLKFRFDAYFSDCMIRLCAISSASKKPKQPDGCLRSWQIEELACSLRGLFRQAERLLAPVQWDRSEQIVEREGQ